MFVQFNVCHQSGYKTCKDFYDLFKRFINTDLLQYQYFDNEILKICFMANVRYTCMFSFLDYTVLHTISQTIFSKIPLLCVSHHLLKIRASMIHAPIDLCHSW